MESSNLVLEKDDYIPVTDEIGTMDDEAILYGFLYDQINSRY